MNFIDLLRIVFVEELSLSTNFRLWSRLSIVFTSGGCKMKFRLEILMRTRKKIVTSDVSFRQAIFCSCRRYFAYLLHQRHSLAKYANTPRSIGSK